MLVKQAVYYSVLHQFMVRRESNGMLFTRSKQCAAETSFQIYSLFKLEIIK
jgi:hypothetical protein